MSDCLGIYSGEFALLLGEWSSRWVLDRIAIGRGVWGILGGFLAWLLMARTARIGSVEIRL